LFSRVMQVGLNTGVSTRRPEIVLCGAVFSEADDCAVLVFSL